MSWEAKLEALVKERIGATVGLADADGSFGSRLRRLVTERVEVLRLAGPAHYIDLLVVGSKEESRLIAALTNPHSWFFRGERSLVRLLEQLSRRGRSVDLWCAACAGGEEPYSLAILAEERSIPVTIWASDVDIGALETARAGVYSRFSTRLVSPARLERYFERVGKQWRVHPRIRERVTLRRHNLTATALAPPSARGWAAISCRNALIYFHRQDAADVYQRFSDALDPSGALLTAASDPLPPRSLFRTSVEGSTVLHYRSLHSSRPPTRSTLPPPMTPGPAPPVVLGEAPIEPAPPRSVRPPFSELPAPPGPLAARAERYRSALMDGHGALGRGEYEAALEAYERATLAAPLRHEPYFLTGVAHRRNGAPQSALVALRRALFIEPSCWPAAFLLGGLFAQLHEPGQSRLAYAQALRDLDAGTPASAELRAAPGLNLDRVKVRELCDIALRSDGL